MNTLWVTLPRAKLLIKTITFKLLWAASRIAVVLERKEKKKKETITLKKKRSKKSQRKRALYENDHIQTHKKE